MRGARVATLVALLLVVLAVLNWTYQAARKPAELLSPLSAGLYKTPAETWRQYHRLFQQHSTPVITPQLLAALAQVEGAGNPVATTYWRWSLSWNPGEVYRPASSAVGMYQMTDAAFQDARRYCIRDHAATLKQKQDLAAVIHLCGATAGEACARRGFRPGPSQRCGEHRLASYLAQVNAMKRQFTR